jgi:predicted permease
MDAIFTDIFPVLLIALFGYLLKAAGIMKINHGDFLLRLVFYVTLPSLIMVSFSKITLTVQFAYLPLITTCIISIMYLISSMTGRWLKLPGRRMGVFIIGTMILNIGFLLPFVRAAYGEEGLSRLLVFDFMNGILAFTWVYYIACKHGKNAYDRWTMLKKFLSAIPIWAIIISITLNLSQVILPKVIYNTFQLAGDTTIPLIMFSLGAYFSPRLIFPRAIVMALLIRMVLGLFLGFLFSELFDISGLTRMIVLLGSSAPIGFNSITFASLEDLDKEFAASLVSSAIVIGIIYVPLFILFNTPY